MSDIRSWIVCYTLTKVTGNAKDRWEVFESYEEAAQLYSRLYHNDNVYSRSICAVIQSSDYEPHPAFKESHDHN
jgi:hypothetical protein